MVGSSLYILYCCQLLHTSSMVVYGASVLLGAGAAIIWTSQGFILACNSCEKTIQRWDCEECGCVGDTWEFRNCGLFWSIFHLSGVIGNLFVLLILQSGEGFDKRTRSLVRYLDYPLHSIKSFQTVVYLLSLTSTGTVSMMFFKWSGQSEIVDMGKTSSIACVLVSCVLSLFRWMATSF